MFRLVRSVISRPQTHMWVSKKAVNEVFKELRRKVWSVRRRSAGPAVATRLAWAPVVDVASGADHCQRSSSLDLPLRLW